MCEHRWELRDKRPWCLPYYFCTECKMELSFDQYEALKQAHRKGWEQAKMEAVAVVHAMEKVFHPSQIITDRCANAVTAMVYKEVQDEQGV